MAEEESVSQIERVQAFLSIDEEEGLAVAVFHPTGCDMVSLKDFMEDSLDDMPREQRLKYAIAFEKFVKDLRK